MAVTPTLLIVNGLPASGKTTLARRLACDLALPAFCKDDFKDAIFGRLGWSDRDWSRRVGVTTYDPLMLVAEAELAAHRSILLEANFHPELSTGEFLRLRKLHVFRPIQVYCRADPDILIARYWARADSGERHPGHVDIESREEIEEALRGKHAPMALGGTVIEVDTGNGMAYEEVLETVKRAW